MAFSAIDTEILRLIEHDIGDRLEALQGQIAGGRCGDFADYRYRCGQVRALLDILQWAKEANRKALGLPVDT